MKLKSLYRLTLLAICALLLSSCDAIAAQAIKRPDTGEPSGGRNGAWTGGQGRGMNGGEFGRRPEGGTLR